MHDRMYRSAAAKYQNPFTDIISFSITVHLSIYLLIYLLQQAKQSILWNLKSSFTFTKGLSVKGVTRGRKWLGLVSAERRNLFVSFAFDKWEGLGASHVTAEARVDLRPSGWLTAEWR